MSRIDAERCDRNEDHIDSSSSTRESTSSTFMTEWVLRGWRVVSAASLRGGVSARAAPQPSGTREQQIGENPALGLARDVRRGPVRRGIVQAGHSDGCGVLAGEEA